MTAPDSQVLVGRGLDLDPRLTEHGPALPSIPPPKVAGEVKDCPGVAGCGANLTTEDDTQLAEASVSSYLHETAWPAQISPAPFSGLDLPALLGIPPDGFSPHLSGLVLNPVGRRPVADAVRGDEHCVADAMSVTMPPAKRARLPELRGASLGPCISPPEGPLSTVVHCAHRQAHNVCPPLRV